MANYFGGGYPPQQQYQQNNNVIVVTVQGEQGASMYPVAAGNTVLLIDFNIKKFWLKATDINGLPARFDAYDFKEVVKPTQDNNLVPRNEFDAVKQQLEYLTNLIEGKKNVSANAK